jgi:glycosyltransferase involved in cell wall biosynthesis
MMHGVPVLSHVTPHDNGQIEIIAGGGMVAVTPQEYGDNLMYLINNPKARRAFGAEGRRIAMALYAQDKVVNAIQEMYRRWVGCKK